MGIFALNPPDVISSNFENIRIYKKYVSMKNNENFVYYPAGIIRGRVLLIKAWHYCGYY